MTIRIRPVGDDDAGWRRLASVDALSFGTEVDLDHPDRGVMELDRTLIAWDGGDAVGCASVFSLELSLPGGSAPAAGVTWVGVVPTHRRRGVMTALLDTVHSAARERHEPLAALWASQPEIYQRFGYGVASRLHRLTIPAAVDLSRAPAATDVDVRLVEAADDAPFTRPVYDAARVVRPGMPALDDRWHAYATSDSAQERDGGSPLRTFVASRGGQPVGYARFRTKHDWSQGPAEGTTRLREMVALDPGARAALWRQVHGLELMTTTSAWNTPLDDPVLAWLSDIRRVPLRLADQLFVRVLDLPAAVHARTFRCAVDVVLEVSDTAVLTNAGRWRVSGDRSGARCEPTTAPADLQLDIRSVGAAILGSTTLTALAAAGDVVELRPGALDLASLAWSHPVAAWCPWVF